MQIFLLLTGVYTIVALITYFKNRKKLEGKELSRRVLRNSLIGELIYLAIPIAIVLIILCFFLGDSGTSVLVIFFGD